MTEVRNIGVLISQPGKTGSVMASFPETYTICQVIESSVKRLGLKYDENFKYVLRYCHQLLDPLMTLGQSKIPAYAKLCLENVAHLNSKVNVVVEDVDDGHTLRQTYNDSENLWNIVDEMLTHKGKYIEEDRIVLSNRGQKFTGVDLLKSTTLKSISNRPKVHLLLQRKQSMTKLVSSAEPSEAEVSNADVDTKSYESGRSSDSKTSIPLKPFDDRHNIHRCLVGLRNKMQNMNHECRVSSIGKFQGSCYYLESRSGFAYRSNISMPPVNCVANGMLKNSVFPEKQFKVKSLDGNINCNVELIIRFPERVSFNAIFNNNETIGDVLDFIRPYLRTDVPTLYLYTASPRLMMVKDKILKDIVYFTKNKNTLLVGYGPSENIRNRHFLKLNIVNALYRGGHMSTVLGTNIKN